MNQGDSNAGGLFRNEFLDKGLVTFAECSAHYATFDSDELMSEMRLLFGPLMLAIPFGVAGTRYYALMDALIRCAGGAPDLSDRERSKLVNICIDVCTFLRSRTTKARQDAFAATLSTALHEVAASSLYPHVAALISQGIRDYSGPFEQSAVPALQASPQRRSAGAAVERQVA